MSAEAAQSSPCLLPVLPWRPLLLRHHLCHCSRNPNTTAATMATRQAVLLPFPLSAPGWWQYGFLTVDTRRDKSRGSYGNEAHPHTLTPSQLHTSQCLPAMQVLMMSSSSVTCCSRMTTFPLMSASVSPAKAQTCTPTHRPCTSSSYTPSHPHTLTLSLTYQLSEPVEAVEHSKTDELAVSSRHVLQHLSSQLVLCHHDNRTTCKAQVQYV